MTREQQTFIDKLMTERDDIIAKIERLNSFLYSGKTASISNTACALLEKQREIMEDYIQVLNCRIDCYKTDNNIADTD